MKFTLSRHVISQDLRRIVSREMRKQKLTLEKLSTPVLKELALVTKTIAAQGLPPHLLCKKLPYNLGHGIFLHPHAEALPKGKLLAPYAGELSLIRQMVPDDGSYAFTPVENMQLTKEEQARYDSNSYYRPNRLYTLKVDALHNGNFTRYINHSHKPNIVAYTLVVPQNSHGLLPSPVEVLYFVKKTVFSGEQLLVSYEDGEKSYWSGPLKPFPMTPKTFQLRDDKIIVF